MTTVELVYSGHLGTSLKCPDYQGVLIFQVNLHVNGYFETITKCPDYGGALISSVLINRFQCKPFNTFVLGHCMLKDKKLCGVCFKKVKKLKKSLA